MPLRHLMYAKYQNGHQFKMAINSWPFTEVTVISKLRFTVYVCYVNCT